MGEVAVVRVPVEDLEGAAVGVDLSVGLEPDIREDAEDAFSGMVAGPVDLGSGHDHR